MDWPGVLLTAVATVVALWLLLKYELKESEGRNGKAHDDIRGRIKESEGRNNQAHAELSTRIDNGFNRLNDTLMKMSNDVGFIRGWQERGERGKQPESGDGRRREPGG